MDDETKKILMELGDEIEKILLKAEGIKNKEIVLQNSFEVGYLNGICQGLKQVLLRIDARFKGN